MATRADEAFAADVIDLTHDGRGVSEVSGRRIFVPGALPSEQVLLRTRKRRRKFQEAELVEVLEPASNRVDPPCPYFGVCGGCSLQHLEYAAQVAFKQRGVVEALRRIGDVEPDRAEAPVTGAQWNYRRRARLGIKYVAGKGRVLVGFRERGAPLVTDMQSCRNLVEPMDRLPGALAELLADSPIRDRIPQAEIAVGDDWGAVVLRVLEPPARRDRDALVALGADIGADFYLQSGGPDTIVPIAQPARPLSYTLQPDGLRLGFEPGDFIQVNAEINQALIAAALDSAGLVATDRVLDLYCGLGNFSLPIAKRVSGVTGVEGSAALVARAASNARLNGIDNAQFLTADLEQADWRFFQERWDVVFLDPARGGASRAIASMDVMQPRRVIYVSCHPGTLARDAGELVRSGNYRLQSIRVLDMFPNTHHVEAIAVFDREH